tara:strand:+ start:142 stop:465 length:324 start_codon:yes stop_codon:yes gene_type:complete
MKYEIETLTSAQQYHIKFKAVDDFIHAYDEPPHWNSEDQQMFYKACDLAYLYARSTLKPHQLEDHHYQSEWALEYGEDHAARKAWHKLSEDQRKLFIDIIDYREVTQ